ncbi:MAG: hypothetical protein HYV13_00730 [Candidatus Doudnabacteria bacterium]|nr:hypothetical protein [Candidatus Doudnabacteria bacterium]
MRGETGHYSGEDYASLPPTPRPRINTGPVNGLRDVVFYLCVFLVGKPHWATRTTYALIGAASFYKEVFWLFATCVVMLAASVAVPVFFASTRGTGIPGDQ